MNKSNVERNIVVLLFAAVLVCFSMAQRDSKKLDKLYAVKVASGILPQIANTIIPAHKLP